MPNSFLNRIKKHVTTDGLIYARKSLDLVDALQLALDKKGWNQADLAKALGKAPSEINKWLNPAHNMTLKTIAKLEDKLEVTLLATPVRYQAKQQSLLFGHEFEQQHYRALVDGSSMTNVSISVSTHVTQVSEATVVPNQYAAAVTSEVEISATTSTPEQAFSDYASMAA